MKTFSLRGANNVSRTIKAIEHQVMSRTRPAVPPVRLGLQKGRGRLPVNEYLGVPEVSGLWAAGDCAAVPTGEAGQFWPPTAQHGLREAITAAKNIEAAIEGRPLKPFVFTTLGQLATIGRRNGLWVQVLRFYRLGDVAKHLFNEAAAPGEEAPRHDGLDAGSAVRPRDRTDGHIARYPAVKRSIGSHSSSNKARMRRTNRFS
jgi:hypothetical protein